MEQTTTPTTRNGGTTSSVGHLLRLGSLHSQSAGRKEATNEKELSELLAEVAASPSVFSQDTCPTRKGITVPETPNLDRLAPKQYPSKHEIFACDWCMIPLQETEEALEATKKQCFVCGFAICAECEQLGKGKTLVNIGRRNICDECTRDLVHHVETYAATPIKRLKIQKRNIRSLNARGHVYTVKRSLLD